MRWETDWKARKTMVVRDPESSGRGVSVCAVVQSLLGLHPTSQCLAESQLCLRFQCSGAVHPGRCQLTAQVLAWVAGTQAGDPDSASILVWLNPSLAIVRIWDMNQ